MYLIIVFLKLSNVQDNYKQNKTFYQILIKVENGKGWDGFFGFIYRSIHRRRVEKGIRIKGYM